MYGNLWVSMSASLSFAFSLAILLFALSYFCFFVLFYYCFYLPVYKEQRKESCVDLDGSDGGKDIEVFGDGKP